MKITPLLLILSLSSAAFMSSCEKKSKTEKAVQQLEKAGKEVQKEAEKAADKAKDAVNDALDRRPGEPVRDAVEDAADKLKQP